MRRLIFAFGLLALAGFIYTQGAVASQPFWPCEEVSCTTWAADCHTACQDCSGLPGARECVRFN